MRRAVLSIILWLCLSALAGAQALSGLARALPEGSAITAVRGGGVVVSLALSQGVPFRVFVVRAPQRLVLEFAQVDFSGLDREALLSRSKHITNLRTRLGLPGWSRLELDLAAPMLPEDVAMQIDQETGRARLTMRLRPAEAQEFDQVARLDPIAPSQKREGIAPRDTFTVVLDPGHGGKDPGAEVEGLIEKDLVLDFARELRDLLRREGVSVVLTRDRDEFLSLQARIARAHEVEADMFLSIHADTVTEGRADGATLYTLSDKASDQASAQLVARHNRAAVLAGSDLRGADDEVAGVLLDLARIETRPRTAALASLIAEHMQAAGGPMNRHPLRAGGFLVLTSADIPSVLLEIGFLSSQQDRRNIADPVWRSLIADSVASGILAWRTADEARAGLVRQ